MKLVEIKCKNCNSSIKVEEDSDYIKCEFCGSTYKLDDEVKHIKYDDMEQSGYDFEKGRIRAQQEHSANVSDKIYSPKTKKNNRIVWIVLAWIFLFPFTATYFIAKSEKLDKKKKIIIIVVMWIVFLLIAAFDSVLDREEKKNRIIECYSQEAYDKLDELIGMDDIDGHFSDSFSCDKISLKNQRYEKIDIEMDGDNLISIKLGDKYIYNIDESVEIYDPSTLRIK